MIDSVHSIFNFASKRVTFYPYFPPFSRFFLDSWMPGCRTNLVWRFRRKISYFEENLRVKYSMLRVKPMEATKCTFLKLKCSQATWTFNVYIFNGFYTKTGKNSLAVFTWRGTECPPSLICNSYHSPCLGFSDLLWTPICISKTFISF